MIYDAKFKTKVVMQILVKSMGLQELSKKYGIASDMIEEWCREFLQNSSGDHDRTTPTLFPFMEKVISGLLDMKKYGTADTYKTTLRSFKRFRNGEDIALDKLESDTIKAYEAYLTSKGLSPNSTSFYMRILRATYNRAVEQEVTIQRFPFRNVYTGVEKTAKRALPLCKIRQIKNLDLSDHPAMEFARDMFIFSFLTRGMSFIDMAYLKKTNLKNGILTYRRHKTKQQLTIKWEADMQRIVEKYGDSNSTYLLPIIPDENGDTRKKYKYASHNINRYLKIIGKLAGISIPLTMYVSRHSWASIAKSKHIPLSVISQGMGHDSEKTTMIYLATLDTLALDKANNLIIKLL